MAIVQTAEGRTTGSVDSFGLAFGSNIGAGRLLVICAGSYTEAVLAGSITDTLGHTYTLDRHEGGTQRAAILSTPNSSAGANTVTINTASNSYFSLVLYEISDMHASPVDVTNGMSNTSSPIVTGTFTPTVAVLAIGHATHETGGSPTLTSGSGWTTDQEDESSAAIPYSAQSRSLTAGTFQCDWTPGSVVSYAACVVAYKTAAVSAGQPFVRRFGGVPHAAGRISNRSW